MNIHNLLIGTVVVLVGIFFMAFNSIFGLIIALIGIVIGVNNK